MRTFSKSLACFCVVGLLAMSAKADVAIISFSYTNLDGAYDDTNNVFSATGISNSTGDMNRIVAPTGQAHFTAGGLTGDVIFDMTITNVTGFNVGDTADGEGTFTFKDADTTEITGSIEGTWTLNTKIPVGGGNFITGYTFFGFLSDVNINNDSDTFDGNTGSWSTDFSGIVTEPYHGFFVTLALNFADLGAGWFEEGDYSGADVNTIGFIRGDLDEACELDVTVEGCVITPPPPPDRACNKPIDELTMIWDGSVPIRVIAWKGAVNSTQLADIDNIQVGDEVSIAGFAGSPNDVFWEIFDAGTSDKIGESSFHLSCSDQEMNGPEDCGLRQGNGKSNNPDLINDWIFEGFVDVNGAIDCTPDGNGGGEPPECITEIPPGDGPSCPEGRELRSVQVVYSAADCSATMHGQDPSKVSCEDFAVPLARLYRADDVSSVAVRR